MMQCRNNCGACCIAPSISTPMPDLPQGKPAGEACLHLDKELNCLLFGLKTRPQVCSDLQPNATMCGNNRSEALAMLKKLEFETMPIEILP